ncbi:unnamed protein product, partial [Prorocentrum cordatum]
MLFVLPQFCYAFQRKIPPPGTRVQYELGVDPKKGEPLAKNVQPTGEPPVELSAKGTRAWGADWDGGAWDWAQDQDWGEDSGGDWGSAPAPPTMRAPPAADPDGVRTGTISRSVAKFGYVAQDSGEPDLFVLPAACKGFELAIPPPGTRVAYRRGRDPKGMPVAQDVRPEADVRPAKALRGMIGRNRISTSSATSCGTAGRPTSSCSPGSAQPSAAASRRWARASPSPSGRARGSPRRRTSAPRRPRSPRPPRGPGRAGGRGPARRGGARRARPRRRRGGKDLGEEGLAGAFAAEAAGIVTQNKGKFGFITQDIAGSPTSSCCPAPAVGGRSPPSAPAWPTPSAPTPRRGSPSLRACAPRASRARGRRPGRAPGRRRGSCRRTRARSASSPRRRGRPGRALRAAGRLRRLGDPPRGHPRGLHRGRRREEGAAPGPRRAPSGRARADAAAAEVASARRRRRPRRRRQRRGGGGPQAAQGPVRTPCCGRAACAAASARGGQEKGVGVLTFLQTQDSFSPSAAHYHVASSFLSNSARSGIIFLSP